MDRKSLFIFTVFLTYLASSISKNKGFRPNIRIFDDEIYTSTNLIVKKTNVYETVQGNNVNFTCALPKGPQIIDKCELVTPHGKVWLVYEGKVFEDGVEVSGYYEPPGIDSRKVCGLDIQSYRPSEDQGDWECIISRSEGSTPTVRGRINLRSEEEELNTLRLPGNVVPLHYDISIIALWEPDFITEGTFSIEANIYPDQKNEGLFSLNFRFISFNESSLVIKDIDSSTTLQILEHIYDFERDICTIRFKPIITHSVFRTTVSGQFFGIILNNPDLTEMGFYLDFYEDETTGQEIKLAVTHFETNTAHYAFPCLDEPAFKATFRIRIGRLNKLQTLSNTELETTGTPVENHDGYVWDEYAVTPVISTYIVAFTIMDFDHIDSEILSNGVVVKSWARPDAIAHNLAFLSTENANKIILGFENILGVSYLLRKMDHIAIPQKGGAMENIGLITYGEFVYLLDESECGDINKYIVLATNAHELSHQWFGNLVTMDWWTHIWLNEGLATFMTYFGIAITTPEMNPWDRFYVDEILEILEADAFPDSRIMLEEIEDPSDANFGSLTYNRGGTMMRMIASMITFSTLTKGLTRYLQSHAFTTTVTDDMWDALDETAIEDGTLGPINSIKEVMDTWFYQRNYPVITVLRNYSSGHVIIGQERFLLKEDNADHHHNYQWYIPTTHTILAHGKTDFNSSAFQVTYVKPNSSLQFDLGDTKNPVIFNVRAFGYYRTNYDEKNWNMISDYLQTPNFTDIHPVNRAQILNDAFSLAKVGLQTYDLILKISQYLFKENHEIPLLTAKLIFDELITLKDLSPEEQHLLDLLVKMFSEKYDDIGMEEYPDNGFFENYRQRHIVDVACIANYTQCVNDAVSVFGFWMQLPNPDAIGANPVNRQIRQTVYCTAVRSGGDTQVDFLLERLDHVYTKQEEYAIYGALGCYVSQQNHTRLFDTSFKKIFLEKTNPDQYFKTIVSHKKTALITSLKWIVNHFTTLAETWPNKLAKVLAVLAEEVQKMGCNYEDEVIMENVLKLCKGTKLDMIKKDIIKALNAIKMKRR